MPTTNRGYATPATGTEVDTWGDVLNANAELIDNNLGALVTVALTSSDVTLSSAQYKCGTIRLTGALSNSVAVIFPAVQGWWTVDNQTTGNYVVCQMSGGTLSRGIPQAGATDIFVDGSNVQYRNFPHIGTYWDYAGSAVPSWVSSSTIPPYLLCDGSTFSSVTFPYLFSILGTTTLPDSRGRGRFNLNGGTGRITTAGSGINGDVRFSGGGLQTVQLTQSNIPNYNISISSLSWTGTISGVPGNAMQNSSSGNEGVGANNPIISGGTPLTVTGSVGGTLPSGGSGTEVNKMPPAYIGGITMIRAG